MHTPDNPPVPQATSLSPAQREQMLHAAREVLECHRVLHRGGLSLTSEIMRGHADAPILLEHYPPDDVIDHQSGAQFYYHAHRGESEHGHFHCFVRIPNPHANTENATLPVHLGAISMDHNGLARALFATNRWVTDEHWLPAELTIKLLDRFVIDHANPSWPMNRWISAMLVLYRPHFEALLKHRDLVLNAWQQQAPEIAALDDEHLEITGVININTKAWIAELAQNTQA